MPGWGRNTSAVSWHSASVMAEMPSLKGKEQTRAEQGEEGAHVSGAEQPAELALLMPAYQLQGMPLRPGSARLAQPPQRSQPTFCAWAC